MHSWMLNQLSQSFEWRSRSPVVVVKDDETPIPTAKGNLVTMVVPPVGMRLSVDDVAENDHVPAGICQPLDSFVFCSKDNLSS